MTMFNLVLNDWSKCVSQGRQGQTKTCYLYRFYTEGTVEEHLMREHSNALQNLAMPEEASINVYNEPPVVPLAVDAHEVKEKFPQEKNIFFIVVVQNLIKIHNFVSNFLNHWQ